MNVRTGHTLNRLRKSWLLLAVVVLGGLALLAGAAVVIASSQGADLGDVFNEPARTADDTATIEWFEGDALLRDVEPQTVEGIEFAWTRALAAVGNASNGDATGIDVWFSGPASDQMHELLATGTVVDGGSWASHKITPNFYSIDGQILMVDIDRAGPLNFGTVNGEIGNDTVRVVFVLRDGNWRVEHLVRTAAQ